jgi:DNA-binding NarL/FixJ family response regulator
MREPTTTGGIRRHAPFISSRRFVRVMNSANDGHGRGGTLRIPGQPRDEEVDIDFVVVCDDRAVVRLGLEAMLRSEVPALGIRTVTTLPEGLEVAERHEGRVLLLVGGRQATADLGQQRSWPQNLRIVLLLPDADPARLRRAATLKVSGYLVEDALRRSSVRSVLLDVSTGAFPMPEAMADVLLGRDGSDPGLARLQLTDLQVHVLELLASGATNRSIATSLDVPLHSVKRQVTKLLNVLQCENRTTAATKAVQIGLIAPEHRFRAEDTSI